MNLCPICDHKLTGGFCPSCKKLIRNPLVIPDGIRLNESHYGNDDMCEFHANDRHIPFMNQRHPEHETDCSYHDADFQEKLPQRKQPSSGPLTTQTAGPRTRLFVLLMMLVLLYITASVVISLYAFLSQIHI